MNGKGEYWQCCLGSSDYLTPTLPNQASCKANARDTKCPSSQCKRKARLTKPPRLLGMQNDTTACFVSKENPKGFVTGSEDYILQMFDLLDQTVRAQPVSVLMSGQAISRMFDNGTPNRLMEEDVTGDTICPSQFTTIEQSKLHWVALVGVTICDGQSFAWPCEPDDPTPREYWKFRNSYGVMKFEPRAHRIHLGVPTSGNEKEYAFGYFYMERATWKNDKWNIINPCGLLNGDGYNLGGVVVPPIDGIELVP